MVATVLLILITVAAVGIIWSAIMPMITKSLQIGQACTNAKLTIDTQQGYTCYSESKKEVSVMISRGVEDFELAGMQIGLSSSGKTKIHSVYEEHSIILNMPFEEGSGFLVDDLSMAGNDGTIYGGVTWVDGKIGKALSFNGVNDKVQTSKPILSGNSDFTISAWIYAVSDASDAEYIAGNYGTGNSGGIEFFIYDNKLAVYINYYVWSSVGSIQADRWYYVAVTREAGNIKLYINDIQDGSGTLAISIDNFRNFVIGNGPDFTTESFESTIDELKIYNRSLSVDEIRQEYENGKEGNQIIYLELPSQNEAKTYSILGSNIEEVSIAPVIKIGDTEKVCDVTSKVKVPRCA